MNHQDKELIPPEIPLAMPRKKLLNQKTRDEEAKGF